MSDKSVFPNVVNMIKEGRVYWREDLGAGLTTATLLIPQSMAYAMLAGLPPQMGLYAASLPILAYALLGSSRTLSVGPVAMDSILTASTLGVIFAAGSQEYFAGASALAALVGVSLVLMSVLRVGKLVKHISDAMMSGFTSAAAIIIALSQLKHLLGLEYDKRPSKVYEVLAQAWAHLGETHLLTLGVGLASLAIFKGLPKLAPKVPAGLVGVVGMIGLSIAFGWGELGVKTVGDVPQGLPSLDLSAMSTLPGYLTNPDMIMGALSIALLAFMEAMAIGKAVATRHGYEIKPGQELLALGGSNIAAALFGAYPVAGGFSRTAVNDRAGARTPIASLITMLMILLVVWRFTPALYDLPKSTLAAMIMGAVLGLIDAKAPQAWFKHDKKRALIWGGTFLITLGAGLQLGIVTGVVLSVALRPKITEGDVITEEAEAELNGEHTVEV
jgi:SulP family sulfate permease